MIYVNVRLLFWIENTYAIELNEHVHIGPAINLHLHVPFTSL